MKTSALSRVFLITTTGISLGLFGVSVSATSIKVAITVDNSYALFVGSETSATTFVGKDFDWPSTETYTFDLPSSQFIYV
ncbi:MAG: hypothetical protein JNL97_00825, partial [Verrucomicrobiales bacterium]|nr:hypothetical protein [Verrucomicrobiales bacterium]